MGVASIPVIVGPTAVGKTALALALARHIDLEVVSADSRQIYRRLDIATAKPTRGEQRRVPHHGLDLVDPGVRFSAGRYSLEATGAIRAIGERGRLPVVVGGTGLYVRALMEGLFLEPPMEPARRRALAGWLGKLSTLDLARWAGRLDPGFQGGGRQRAMRAVELALLTGHPLTRWQAVARRQTDVAPWYVLLRVPRPVLHRRIQTRAEVMVRQGMIEEVAAVLSEGHAASAPGLDAVGVREAVEYLHGKRTRDSVSEAVATSTRQLAKRQETWFRHQLRGAVLTMDATRHPDHLAEELAAAWNAAGHVPARSASQ